jgi:pimeloyl-ACP methyl ester carboxylesterase
MAAALRSPTSEDFRGCMAETPRTVSTASGSIEYAERGRGEAVLSIHGTLGGWDQGLVAAEYLRVNGFRIVAPSRPGYLGTPLSTGRIFAQQGDALAALLDVLEIDRIIVFAVSGGGPAGYELAARHADRVSTLVQVDAVCIPGPTPAAAAQLFARDTFARAQLWLLKHATRQTLTALLRVAGSDEKAVSAERAATLLSSKDDPEVAIVSLDHGDGQVVAMVGGRDFAENQFKLATQGRRQAGSAFKPFVLVAA